MERYPLRQSANLASNANVQSGPIGLEFTPLQEQPNIQYIDDPEYSEAKFQIDRWGNWVKYVSIFIMLKSLTSILGVGYNLLSSNDMNQQERDSLTLSLIALIISLVAGFIGFKAGTERSVKAAKCYIIMIVISIIVDGVELYCYLPIFIEGVCENLVNELNKSSVNKYYCDYESALPLYIIAGIMYLVMSLLLFTPIIWCPYKLIKYSEIVSRGARKIPIQIPAQAIPFNPVIGQPLNP